MRIAAALCFLLALIALWQTTQDPAAFRGGDAGEIGYAVGRWTPVVLLFVLAVVLSRKAHKRKDR